MGGVGGPWVQIAIGLVLVGEVGAASPIHQLNGPFPVEGLCGAHHNQARISSHHIAEVHHNNFAGP